ncbi:CRISPR-associated helicase Cas3' [Campylobacter fetus]|uniref:CRISPR-associated helicase Cas3' n=2 Tax=Campylobacter fetus TaxID=196 RepID=UPI000DA33B0B|nr:CRISPR-associated helicase Cas3' [Campylobacter fetus]EJC3761047.1 CRISPR-associated helicase Cas3' [Campylobacter fetus]EJC3776638.1 CRISPR-associated helicase Cas3' [Campylobacter fetus]EKA8945144.1 CRISPR-associated helicase Cas3' [Campylobacter fetus]EKR7988257.1 CRISPR-associated helicase Cas3' [Campylobacter fetus]EKR8007300.1 CRISPR-associated helicase Cas3' [Campylobacter fetus]
MFLLGDYLAHTSPHKDPETLQAHCDLAKEYLQKIKNGKNLNNIIKNLANKILDDDVILEFFDDFIVYHDLGKTNPAFQKLKMKNENPKFSKADGETTHSKQSFYMLKDKYKDFILNYKDENIRETVCVFYYLLSNVLNHHGHLKDGFDDKYLNKDSDKLDKKFCNAEKRVNFDIELFIFIKLHFSLLIASDFYATSEYMNDIKIDDLGVFDKDKKEKIYSKFREFYSSLKPRSDIDSLRSEIFKNTSETLYDNLDKNIFYLEAPTGSGKTLTSLNLALNLLNLNSNLNKIFYVFPFNTLISQSKSIFETIFGDEFDISIINSITPPKFSTENEQENSESNYDKTYINRVFYNHPFILTSHVALFKTLFGISKEENYGLFSLANSVIILDEIQSYRSNLWEFMALFFDSFAKHLNIKFIIMSATLPKISNLLKNSDDKWCDLLPNSNYFQNTLFKDRVKADFSLLNIGKNDLFDSIVGKITESKKDKILVEFIKKPSAREFYNFIRFKFDDYDIFELSGDDNKLYQKKVIAKLKGSNTKAILVATQVIEAGVDIDMDIGFKDIATFESEEQFMGRINRSALKPGSLAYFFDYDDASAIYKQDSRIKFSLKDNELKKCLIDKNFIPYYDKLLKELKSENSRVNSGFNNIRENFQDDIGNLNFIQISKNMQLINDDRIRIFLPFKIDVSSFDMSEYGNIEHFMDGDFLDGKKIWEAIICLNEVKEYGKRKIEALSLNSLADIFCFNILSSEAKKLPNVKIEYGYVYIEDYDGLIDEESKLDRTALAKKYKNEDLIL